MTDVFSHWGLLDESQAEEGGYESPHHLPMRPQIGMVLTEAGEVLINRACQPSGCCVAIMIGRFAPGLSRPQSERLMRAWDMALAITHGNSETVHLQPMPHYWRFSRSDYLTIDEWQERQAAPVDHSMKLRRGDRGVRQ